MAEKDRVFKGKIKQSGIFDFKDLYEFLFNLMDDEQYDVHESYYREIKKADSKNVELEWKCEKPVPGSNYFKFSISILWLLIALKKTKVKRGEQEVSMDSGTLDIFFTADLIKDPAGTWNKPLMRYFKRIYERFIIKKRIEDYELKLFEEMNEILAEVKAFLAIEGRHSY